MTPNSPKFTFNGLDMASIGRSAVDGLIGLALTLIPMFTVGVNYTVGGHDVTAVIVVGLSLVAKGLRKYMTDHTSTPIATPTPATPPAA